MAIRVIIEFQAKPGTRAELAGRLESIMERLGPNIPGFRGSVLHEALDSPDVLVEIADWDSADAQAAAVEQAVDSGVYAPVFELVAAPPRAVRVRQLDDRV
ncbi:antibiotic biosynthesis monooxygenase [Nocardioides sediminis]|uniref:antibiotic biosynthesis monooxygenase n=1 Tax=Nocardioides sediminis TaxID=433648 RepID=UPI000D308DF2|nr:antibiotic biosynthesis monooxygenase [Nocardioides sediminis]